MHNFIKTKYETAHDYKCFAFGWAVFDKRMVSLLSIINSRYKPAYHFVQSVWYDNIFQFRLSCILGRYSVKLSQYFRMDDIFEIANDFFSLQTKSSKSRV